MIYIYFFIFLYITSSISWFVSKKHGNILFYFCSLFLLIIICLRNINVGIDTFHYAGFFTLKNPGYYGTAADNFMDSAMEPGIFIYAKILRFLFFNTQNPYLYIVFTGLVTTIPLLYFINKKSNNKCFSLFLIFTVMQGGNMIIYSAALRQAISIAIMLIAIQYLIGKKNNYKKKYIITSIIACLFHYSSIITTLLCALTDSIKIRSKTPLYIIIYITVFITFFVPHLGQEMLFKSLSFIDSQLENLRYGYYMNDNSFENINRNIFSAGLNLSLPFIVIFYSKRDKINSFFLKLFIITPCFFLIFSSFEQINRLTSCYWIISMIGIDLKLTTSKLYYILLMFISFFFMIRACHIYINPTNGSGIVPYHFLWE